MTAPACPTDAELAAFHYGDLPAAAVDRVAEHVERCPACDAKLRDFDQRTDPILTALRVKTLIDPGAAAADRNAPTQLHWELTQPAGAAKPLEVPGYDLLEQIGQGGMGVVHKARHRKLKRLTALKLLRTSSDWDRERFRTEAETVARLQHPNIVQIYEVGEQNSLPYLALEYVEGGTLAQFIGGKPQPARPAAELVRTLARAMQYAHEHGVIHRDLKPANILMKTGGKKARDTVTNPFTTMSLMAFVLETTPKIADFGVAKCLDESSSQTADGDVLGTPSYMAPEQARGRAKSVGPTTDVYALGAILYELTTGRPPFDGDHPLETLHQVLEDDPVPPSRLQPRLPRDLETITLKCLQKEPAKRYLSAGALSDDLDRFLDGRPITARPTPFWERLARWTRRRPREAALAGAVAASVCAGLGLGGWQWYAAIAEQHEATMRARTERAARGQAERREALLAFDRGRQLCERGDIDRGLLWLVRGLTLADRVGADNLVVPMRIGLADWARQLATPASDDASAARWPLPHTDPPEGWHAPDWLPVRCLVVSPDGSTVLTGGDHGARLWDARTRRPLGPELEQAGRVMAVNISPDGQFCVTGDDAGHVRLWAVATRQPVGPILQHEREVRSLRFSPDGRRLAVGGPDGRLRLWDLPAPPMLGMPAVFPKPVRAVAASADGLWLLTLGDAGADLWTVDRLAQPVQSYALDGQAVTAVALSPDGRRIALGGGNGILRVWDRDTGPIGTDDARPGVAALRFSPDGTGLLALTNDDHPILRRWAVSDSALRERAWGTMPPPRCAAFQPGGRLLAVGCDNGRVHFFDWATGQVDGRDVDLSDVATALTFSGDGRALAVAGRAGGVAIIDMEERRPTGLRLGSSEPIETLMFDSDAHVLLTGGSDGTIRFWDLRSVLPLGAPLRHGGAVLAASYQPRGQSVWTVGRDGALIRWPTPAGPMAGTPEQLRVWAEVLASGELDDDGAFRPLAAEQVRERRDRLNQLGGAPKL